MSRRRARRDTGEFPDSVTTPEGTTLSVLDSGRLIPPRGDATFTFPETVEAPDGTEWLVEDERLTEPVPADDPTTGETSIEDLAPGVDPGIFDRTFLVESKDEPIATGDTPPIPRPWQGLPRAAVVFNFNFVWDDAEEEWVRDEGNGSGGGVSAVASGTESVASGVEQAVATGLEGADRRLAMTIGADNHAALAPNEPDFWRVDVTTLNSFSDPVVGYFWRWDESQSPSQWVLTLQVLNVGATVDIKWAFFEV